MAVVEKPASSQLECNAPEGVEIVPSGAAVGAEIRGVDLHAIVALIPSSPLFWGVFAASYLTIPAADWLIFRRLWGVTYLCSIGDWLSLLALTGLVTKLAEGYGWEGFALSAVVLTQLLPGILKSARLGYDGKGQQSVANVAEAQAAWERMGRVACVLEQRLPLQLEVSVIVCRGRDGATATFAVAENEHRDGILAALQAAHRGIEDLDRSRHLEGDHGLFDALEHGGHDLGGHAAPPWPARRRATAS